MQASEEELNAVRKKYASSAAGSRPYVLMLDSEENYEGLAAESGERVIADVFALLSRFNTLVKGHPRLGSSHYSVDRRFQQIIPHIPIEFVDLSNCRCVVGYYSIALANIANMGIKAISLLKVMPYIDTNVRQSRILYLEQYAPNRILYPLTTKELEREIADIA